MYAFDIIINNLNPKYEDVANDASSYVYFLDRTGQILKREHPVIQNKNTITISVLCPEIDSFSLKYCNQNTLQLIYKIETNCQSKIEYIPTGRDIDNLNYYVPNNSSFYILRNGWSSPLICGDTHQAIPLYKIPYTDHNSMDYDNINFWNHDYQRLFGLWLGGMYEGFATEELQNVHSKINKVGRELSKIIENLTGVPTYYFLFNYRAWSEQEDLQRKCPLTGKDWLIEGKSAEDFIAFKCKESQLVSELSYNCDAPDSQND